MKRIRKFFFFGSSDPHFPHTTLFSGRHVRHFGQTTEIATTHHLPSGSNPSQTRVKRKRFSGVFRG